jgi:catechol 2,3-dioxygenase-like lactoylglutathione lyase family enzyme
MKRIWTIIGVRDVATSLRWYQSLLGLPLTKPAHDDFAQVVDTDGTVLLSLHAWGAHDHPPLMSPENGTPGNGLLLFFRVDDFEQTLARGRALVPASKRSRASIRIRRRSSSRSGIRMDTT